ncbi:MAG: hypothetical protein NXI31_21425 [bacterium]|nr:hypothetical protein [bacterium]
MKLRSPVLALATAATLISATAAQCPLGYQDNWNGIHTSTDDFSLRRSFVIHNLHPFPIRICQIDVRMRNGGCTSASMHLEVRTSDASGQPGALRKTSPSQSIPSSVTTRSATFTNLVLAAGERNHVVIDYENTNPCGFFATFVDLPATSSGPRVESWSEVQQSGVTFWLRDDQPLRYRVSYEPWERANWNPVGSPCGTSVACGTTPYRTLNWNGNPPLGNLFNDRRAFRMADNFGYPSRWICGLDLPIGSLTPPSRLRVSILSDTNGDPGSVLSQTDVTVTNPVGSIHAAFDGPARIGAGMSYWIGFESLDGDQLSVPAERFGSAVNGAVWNGTSWQSNGSTSYATRTYITTSTPLAPTLTGDPAIIGTTKDTDLTTAPANTIAMLGVGFSNPATDLSSLGAPGCIAQSSAELVVWTVTDGLGRATVSLPVPYEPAFLGVELHEQFATLTNQNALGISFSNGALVEIGSF